MLAPNMLRYTAYTVYGYIQRKMSEKFTSKECNSSCTVHFNKYLGYYEFIENFILRMTKKEYLQFYNYVYVIAGNLSQIVKSDMTVVKCRQV